eukprot:scaffold8953_cov171-Amphora_coffeaeformis.AAC.8
MQPHHSYGLASSYNPIRQQFTRSSPIAIKRNNNQNSGGDRAVDSSSDEEDNDKDDDEEDNGMVDVVRDAVKLGLVGNTNRGGTTARSLPSRLLRAPLLGSVPTNEDYLLYRNIPSATLPPPMTLNDSSSAMLSGVVLPDSMAAFTGSVNTTSYGSLRESNQKGRFLDGPSSYRDGRTGDIRRVEQRVRFHEQQATTEEDDLNNKLSIRDRMKQAREQRNNNNEINPTKKTDSRATNKKPTSSLAAMFDDTNADSSFSASGNSNNQHHYNPRTAATAFRPASFHDSTSPFYDTNHHISAIPSGALSTSLTGLEMLQRGLRLATITDHDSHQSGGEEVSHASGTATPVAPQLLSRSFSDPREARRLAETQQNRSPGVAPSVSQNHNFLPPFALGGTAQQHFIPPLHLGGSATASTTSASPLAAPVTSHLSAALSQPDNNNTMEDATAAVASLSLLDNTSNNNTISVGVADPDLEGAFEMDLE